MQAPKLNEKAYPNGICPFWSNAMAMAVPDVGMPNVVLPASAQAGGTLQAVIAVPCAGERCQLWDAEYSRCSFVTLPMLGHLVETWMARPQYVPPESTEKLETVLAGLADLVKWLKVDQATHFKKKTGLK